MITCDDVTKYISKLKQNIYDGDKGLFSNHIHFAPHKLNVHLSLIMTVM